MPERRKDTIHTLEKRDEFACKGGDPLPKNENLLEPATDFRSTIFGEAHRRPRHRYKPISRSSHCWGAARQLQPVNLHNTANNASL